MNDSDKRTIDDLEDILGHHLDEWRPDMDDMAATDFDERIKGAAKAIWREYLRPKNV